MKAIPADGRPISYVPEMIRCGRKSCGTCPHGPYYYAYWTWGGKKRKAYVGRFPPAETGLPILGPADRPSSPPELPFSSPPELPFSSPPSSPTTTRPTTASKFEGPNGRREIIACMRSMKGLAREKARKRFWNMRALLARDPAGNAAKIAFAEGAFEELCRQEGWALPKGGR